MLSSASSFLTPTKLSSKLSNGFSETYHRDMCSPEKSLGDPGSIDASLPWRRRTAMMRRKQESSLSVARGSNMICDGSDSDDDDEESSMDSIPASAPTDAHNAPASTQSQSVRQSVQQLVQQAFQDCTGENLVRDLNFADIQEKIAAGLNSLLTAKTATPVNGLSTSKSMVRTQSQNFKNAISSRAQTLVRNSSISQLCNGQPECSTSMLDGNPLSLSKRLDYLKQKRKKSRQQIFNRWNDLDIPKIEVPEHDLTHTLTNLYEDLRICSKPICDCVYTLLSSLQCYYSRNTWTENVQKCVETAIRKHLLCPAGDISQKYAQLGFCTMNDKMRDFQMQILLHIYCIDETALDAGIADSELQMILMHIRMFSFISDSSFLTTFLDVDVLALFCDSKSHTLVRIYQEMMQDLPVELTHLAHLVQNDDDDVILDTSFPSDVMPSPRQDFIRDHANSDDDIPSTSNNSQIQPPDANKPATVIRKRSSFFSTTGHHFVDLKQKFLPGGRKRKPNPTKTERAEADIQEPRPKAIRVKQRPKRASFRLGASSGEDEEEPGMISQSGRMLKRLCDSSSKTPPLVSKSYLRNRGVANQRNRRPKMITVEDTPAHKQMERSEYSRLRRLQKKRANGRLYSDTDEDVQESPDKVCKTALPVSRSIKVSMMPMTEISAFTVHPTRCTQNGVDVGATTSNSTPDVDPELRMIAARSTVAKAKRKRSYNPTPILSPKTPKLKSIEPSRLRLLSSGLKKEAMDADEKPFFKTPVKTPLKSARKKATHKVKECDPSIMDLPCRPKSSQNNEARSTRSRSNPNPAPAAIRKNLLRSFSTPAALDAQGRKVNAPLLKASKFLETIEDSIDLDPAVVELRRIFEFSKRDVIFGCDTFSLPSDETAMKESWQVSQAMPLNPLRKRLSKYELPDSYAANYRQIVSKLRSQKCKTRDDVFYAKGAERSSVIDGWRSDGSQGPGPQHQWKRSFGGKMLRRRQPVGVFLRSSQELAAKEEASAVRNSKANEKEANSNGFFLCPVANYLLNTQNQHQDKFLKPRQIVHLLANQLGACGKLKMMHRKLRASPKGRRKLMSKLQMRLSSADSVTLDEDSSFDQQPNDVKPGSIELPLPVEAVKIESEQSVSEMSERHDWHGLYNGRHTFLTRANSFTSDATTSDSDLSSSDCGGSSRKPSDSGNIFENLSPIAYRKFPGVSTPPCASVKLEERDSMNEIVVDVKVDIGADINLPPVLRSRSFSDSAGRRPTRQNNCRTCDDCTEALLSPRVRSSCLTVRSTYALRNKLKDSSKTDDVIENGVQLPATGQRKPSVRSGPTFDDDSLGSVAGRTSESESPESDSMHGLFTRSETLNGDDIFELSKSDLLSQTPFMSRQAILDFDRDPEAAMDGPPDSFDPHTPTPLRVKLDDDMIARHPHATAPVSLPAMRCTPKVLNGSPLSPIVGVTPAMGGSGRTAFKKLESGEGLLQLASSPILRNSFATPKRQQHV